MSRAHCCASFGHHGASCTSCCSCPGGHAWRHKNNSHIMLFLPEKARQGASADEVRVEAAKILPLVGFCQIQATLNQPWARCSVFVPYPQPGPVLVSSYPSYLDPWDCLMHTLDSLARHACPVLHVPPHGSRRCTSTDTDSQSSPLLEMWKRMLSWRIGSFLLRMRHQRNVTQKLLDLTRPYRNTQVLCCKDLEAETALAISYRASGG